MGMAASQARYLSLVARKTNTEYEGQRRFQDRTEKELISEVDQVRKHQAMLKRLIEG